MSHRNVFAVEVFKRRHELLNTRFLGHFICDALPVNRVAG